MNVPTTPLIAPVVLTADAVEALPLVPLGDLDGIHHRVLWQNETSMAGVMTVDAGCHLGRHAHRVNHHHLWVVTGRAEILGIELGPGGYVHIPAGVDHDIDATRTDGCTVFYLYIEQTPGTE